VDINLGLAAQAGIDHAFGAGKWVILEVDEGSDHPTWWLRKPDSILSTPGHTHEENFRRLNSFSHREFGKISVLYL
jgi:hypothetical protein